jgi:hypothetical protein
VRLSDSAMSDALSTSFLRSPAVPFPPPRSQEVLSQTARMIRGGP